MVYATAWTCTTTGMGEDCLVTATSTDMEASSTASTSPDTVGTTTPYLGMSFQENLFLGCVLLFFVSFMAWGRIFKK